MTQLELDLKDLLTPTAEMLKEAAKINIFDPRPVNTSLWEKRLDEIEKEAYFWKKQLKVSQKEVERLIRLLEEIKYLVGDGIRETSY